MMIFDIKASLGTEIFDALMLSYWCLDIPLTFFTAYVTPLGELVTEHRLIAKRYLMSWFFIDIIIIASELGPAIVVWSNRSVDNEYGDVGGAMRVFKLTRMARVMRTMRLLRLAKLREFLFIIQSRLGSETLSLALGIVINVL